MSERANASSPSLLASPAGLTVDPAALGAVCPEQRPLPPLLEPTVQPLVTSPVQEPLVPVDHPRVQVVPTYHLAGWRSARPLSLLRSGAAQRLYRVADALPDPMGLVVLDAHRPLALQQEIYEAAYADPSLPPGFVSEPSLDPSTPPPHLTGGTVDVTLSWEGTPLSLGTVFDDFTARAHVDALEAEPGVERELRRLLYWAMRSEGFSVIACEWWHFEYGTRRWAALTGNVPLYGGVLVPAQRSAP